MAVNALSAPAVAEVSTIPGASVTTTKSSSWSLRANFVVAMTAAAFVIPYAAMFTMLRVWTAWRSPAPEPMTTIFFMLDARRKGRKAVMLWIGPRLLILNYRADDSSVSFGHGEELNYVPQK